MSAFADGGGEEHLNPAAGFLVEQMRLVGARAEMHGVVRRLAADGKAVLMASSDLAELVELCDRVVVFQRGRVVDTLTGDRLDQRSLSTAMNAGFAVGSQRGA